MRWTSVVGLSMKLDAEKYYWKHIFGRDTLRLKHQCPCQATREKGTRGEVCLAKEA